jgi:hypothetical protein
LKKLGFKKSISVCNSEYNNNSSRLPEEKTVRVGWKSNPQHNIQGGYIRLLFDPIKFIVVHYEISNWFATSATLAAHLCNYPMTFWQIYFVLALQFIFISPQIQHIQPNLYQKK